MQIGDFVRIILASKSPRRRELLGELYENFDIMTEETDETLPCGIHPREGVAILAERKGRAVLDKLTLLGEMDMDTLIISSDTLVEKDGAALGKPTSEDDAFRMLSELSDAWHNVHTGIAVHYRGRVLSGTAGTAVHFRAISEEERLWYIDTGEPMDKAGAYGIQGLGGRFVTEIRGDFDTVVGLSLNKLTSLIKEITEVDNK